MKLPIRHIAIALIALACAKENSFAEKLPRPETRLLADSTIISMRVLKGSKLTDGKTFTVKIHVNVRPQWRIVSAKTNDSWGNSALAVTIPTSLEHYFEITHVTEISHPHPFYDSITQEKILWNDRPFDLIATVKVKSSHKLKIPFSLLVSSCACSARGCIPTLVEVPMKFLGQANITLHIAGLKMPREKNFADTPTQ